MTNFKMVKKTKSLKNRDTTILISKGLMEDLQKLKVHPRQSYEEVIRKLMDNEGVGGAR